MSKPLTIQEVIDILKEADAIKTWHIENVQIDRPVIEDVEEMDKNPGMLCVKPGPSISIRIDITDKSVTRF